MALSGPAVMINKGVSDNMENKAYRVPKACIKPFIGQTSSTMMSHVMYRGSCAGNVMACLWGEPTTTVHCAGAKAGERLRLW
eukprot:3947162-Amphidinium_carterae.1